MLKGRSAGGNVRPMAAVLLAGLILLAGAAIPQEPGDGRCDLGVALALGGDIAKAESVFVSLLSGDPAGARALNNLGNLNLMKGDVKVALAFYDQAYKGDPEDPGILLNRSVALMIMGEEDLAQSQAGEAIEMAGGMKNASSMLGLRWVKPGSDASKGAEKTYLSKEEVGALLNAALQSVPTDSVRADSISAVARSKGKVAWRSAGARAADGTRVSQLLYWKR